MRDAIPTLLLYATGAPRWERTVLDTLVWSLGLDPFLRWAAKAAPPRWHQNPYFRSLLSNAYCNLSYVQDWLEAFSRSPLLRVTACNINNAIEFRRQTRRIKEFELVVVLHSAAGDNMSFLRHATAAFQARRGKIVVFFGNEYSLMPEKIQFARNVEADLIASQLPLPAAEWLYSDCTKSRVFHAPPALNPDVYTSSSDGRPIDIGFRGDVYGFSLGDIERTAFIDFVKGRASEWGLACDIQFVRYHREEWVLFLQRCKAIVGAESGTYYLEKDDRTQNAVREYIRQNPDASFAEIYDRFFKHYRSPVSGKCISSRHFEPIGTKTCQLLLEGYYNGILIADKHYICVKKDLSNLDEAIRRLKDRAYCQTMVDLTYEYALSQHTYQHRIADLLASFN